MSFPYEQYTTLAEPLKTFYRGGKDELAQRVVQEIEHAGKVLSELLGQPMPPLEILIAAAADWEFIPKEDEDEGEGPATMLPYWTDVTSPPTLVVPEQMDD